ncbi:hypothetical protein GCM10011613_21210 [Cellvibrio zantedeschiae]|uniref:DUF3108 domain-containing protein n=1 Tax=Cellvibrio zantedeschiae TaxID=1237077 RepID=A0ABQ3B2T8_9GAMM|nr:hypothetical protein [Cellvibrio zantedeschiae]GGY75456.1 hypothetical protein GCM10011613_21210 [Cellvibrio zantedeschiae]
MLASLILAATLWPASVTQQCKPSESSIVVGIATSQSGQFLYCEQMERLSEHQLLVNYSYNFKIFAEKKIDYGENPATPAVEQRDFRSGELRKANINQQILNLQYQANTHKKIERADIPLEQVDVIDAGFDYFIRQHWDELQAGKVLSVNFASMPHLKVLPLRIRKQAPAKCAEKAAPASESNCYWVEVDNAVLRLVLGNIKLTYDQQRRLTTFKGVVNLEDNNESTQTANISYYYHSDYAEK